MQRIIKIILTGLIAGFISKGILGVFFTIPFIKSILYNPNIQSQLFIEITPHRDIPFSVAGLVVLSVIHAWLFVIFVSEIPGETWIKKGFFWRSSFCS